MNKHRNVPGGGDRMVDLPGIGGFFLEDDFVAPPVSARDIQTEPADMC